MKRDYLNTPGQSFSIELSGAGSEAWAVAAEIRNAFESKGLIVGFPCAGMITVTCPAKPELKKNLLERLRAELEVCA